MMPADNTNGSSGIIGGSRYEEKGVNNPSSIDLHNQSTTSLSSSAAARNNYTGKIGSSNQMVGAAG